MKRNMDVWMDSLLESNDRGALPVLSFPCIQKMGISVKELISDSNLQAEGMKLIADAFPTPASVSLMDLSVEAEAFGCPVRFSDEEVPNVLKEIVLDEDDADNLKVPEIGAGRTGIYVDAIRKATELIIDRPVFAGMIGPFSLAGRILSVEEALILCYEEPDMVHKVLKKATEFLISYAKAFKEAGANGIVMAEPLAGLLSPDTADEFSAEYVKAIIDAVQDENYMVIYHNCGGSVPKIIDSILSTGAKMFHFGNAISMKEMLSLMPLDVAVLGNIDPAGILRNGSQDDVKKAVKELKEECKAYPNFILSTGCDVPPKTPWENLAAFFS